MLREACTRAESWQTRHISPAPLISVNLSARQLRGADLVPKVMRVLETSGLDPRCLELEITESVAMAHDGTTRRILRAFKDLGVRLAIDDFGTGYSSLSYLRELPVDSLKIDRTFVAGLGHDPGSQAIIRATTTLAHDLGLSVTAEGVETPEQAQIIRAFDVDRAQGFYFSRPLPGAQAIAHLLAAGYALPHERTAELSR